MWVAFTVFSALMQTWRNALKSRLSQSVGVVGTTFARFIIASPIAACYLMLVYAVQPGVERLPSSHSIFFILVASVLQIVATGLMIKLFQLKNYTIGAGLAKSEALAAAGLGAMFFGSTLSLLGWGGVVIGTVAVFILSTGSTKSYPSLKTLLLGLGSGVLFALTSLCVREASLRSGLPFPHSAAWVLFCVIAVQTILLFGFLVVFDRPTLAAMWSKKGLTCLISVTSCLGSIGWFSAVALEQVAYVTTLGQIEVLFTILISHFWLKDRFKKHETMGLLLIGVSAVMVMWV